MIDVLIDSPIPMSSDLAVNKRKSALADSLALKRETLLFPRVNNRALGTATCDARE
jgi:hypothetical protein